MKDEPEYVTAIGPNWEPVRDWHRTRPDEPFVGIRVERDEVWVACEPLIAGRPIARETRAELERLFDQPGRAWVDEQVFLFCATSIQEAHRVARRAIAILRGHGLRLTPRPMIRQAKKAGVPVEVIRSPQRR